MDARDQGEWDHGADLHFHLLAGIDDGPACLEESLDLARAAVADGTSSVVATPHVRADFFTDVRSLPLRLRELSAALEAERVELMLSCGGELGHDMVGRLTQDELAMVAQGPPGARWLLVEAPFEGIGDDFHAATDELRDRGFAVLIAHPERSADAALDGSAGLRRELAAGSLAQVNALSLTGQHGRDAELAAHALVGEGIVTLVASDAHGPSRPPALKAAYRCMVARGVDPPAARALTYTAPRRLLARGARSQAALAA